MLIPSFTQTANGYTVRLGPDASRTSTGYDSYDLASGRLVISGVSSTQRLPASTALGILSFESLAPGPLVMAVSRLNVNGFSYVSDTSPLMVSSSIPGGTSGGGGADITAPTLSASDPVSGSNISPSKALISLGFSEPVVRGSGTVVLKTASGTTIENFDASSSPRITLSGPVVTIDPFDNFYGSSNYRLVVPAGAFIDEAGNPYAGATIAFTTSASTVDIMAPTLALVTPVSGTNSVATDVQIVLEFSEDVALGSGQIRLLGTGGALVQAFDANSSGVTIAGDTITLAPSVELAKASTYTLQLPRGAIVDKAGNAFAGLPSYQFTTAALAAGELRITLDRTSVDEGGTINVTLRAATTAAGTALSYSLSGIGSHDLDGTAMAGTLRLDSARTAELSIKLRADDVTEGTETLVLNVAGVTASVSISDTSRASTTPQTLKGATGAEVFLLSTGVDVVDGGPGQDTAFVNGQASDFKITRQGISVFIAQESSQNIDTLVGIERVEFADRSVALDTEGGPGQAYRIYQAAFDREPDLAGLGYWISRMDQKMDMIELAQRFVDSAEFRTIYGTQPTNADFVYKLYLNVLDRAPDQAGYAWWVNQMNTDPSKSRAKVLADFSESTENKTALAGQLDDGVEFLPWLG